MPRQNELTFKYYFFIIIGWLLISMGLATAFFMLIAEGDNSRFVIAAIGGLSSIIGVLTVRIVKKNIFKALLSIINGL